jgi:hypothetical protein
VQKQRKATQKQKETTAQKSSPHANAVQKQRKGQCKSNAKAAQKQRKSSAKATQNLTKQLLPENKKATQKQRKFPCLNEWQRKSNAKATQCSSANRMATNAQKVNSA